MTISSIINKVQYACNGITTVFAFNYKFFVKSDLVVTKILISTGVESSPLVLDTDYTISGTLTNNVYEAGANVTMLVAPSALYKLQVRRVVPETQATDYTTSDPFDPNTLEQALDKLTIVDQQQQEEINRSIKFAAASTTVGVTVAEPDEGYGLVWDSDGNLRNTTAPLADLEGDAEIVADNIASVNAVAADLTGDDDIGTVVDNLTNIDIVAGISANVTTVAGISASVTAVAGNATNINAVNANSTNINTVAGINANVTTVAGISANVTTVAGISANVTSVAGNSTNINAVAANATNINAVNANSANINTVAGVSANVTTVATNIANVNTVATNITNINAVADISADVTIVADNIADIQDAEENAIAAEDARDAALAAQASAEAALAATLAAYDNFDDRYLGAKAVDPTVDNDGNPLVAGAIYFNTVDAAMKVYTGTIWVAAYVSGTDFLAKANNLSDISSAAAARANLDLEIGVDVLAYGAALNTINGLSIVQGDILYGSGANAVSRLAKDTNATRYISNGGASNNPAWAQIDLTNGVTGDLPLSNLAQGSALSVLGVAGNATADNASIAAASDHQVMRRSGTAIAFGAVNLAQSAAVTGVLDETNGGTGLNSLTAGDIIYASASNTFSRLAKGTALQTLRMNAGATAPEWATVSVTGRIVQTVAKMISTYDNNAGAAIPRDNTKPQSTEGKEYTTQAFTPTNASSTLKITMMMNFWSNGSGNTITAAMFQDSVADAIGAGFVCPPTSGLTTLTYTFFVAATNTSARTYKIRYGSQSADNIYVNGDTSTGLYNGSALSGFIIEEIL